ncbi:hypothetical protein M427DRAFT_271805 [Gonapodya prolifera JEL478]|uniref:Uncharacterized protein n=1 Tax=Gonapodya prolifera (strain JEL478) TaxID=1344416 RepID=A0A139AXM4_GONPJ|nr:hypothetical protein M427DRAFT_271805 [Gonapodya prolifera JEL478]|eukprot:KXS21501.1 hypothetical protein M427DRAFT_271805 [Gonapodya prolifera JEL478]
MVAASVAFPRNVPERSFRPSRSAHPPRLSGVLFLKRLLFFNRGLALLSIAVCLVATAVVLLAITLPSSYAVDDAHFLGKRQQAPITQPPSGEPVPPIVSPWPPRKKPNGNGGNQDLVGALIPVFIVAGSVLMLLIFFLVGTFCSGPNIPRGSSATPKREDEWFAVCASLLPGSGMIDQWEEALHSTRPDLLLPIRPNSNPFPSPEQVSEIESASRLPAILAQAEARRRRARSRERGKRVGQQQDEDSGEWDGGEVGRALAKAWKFVPNADMVEERGIVYDMYDPFDDISSWGGVSVHEGTSITFRKWTERTVVTNLPLWKPPSTLARTGSRASLASSSTTTRSVLSYLDDRPYVYFEALLSYVGPDQEWLAQNRAIQQVAAVEERVQEAERELRAAVEARDRNRAVRDPSYHSMSPGSPTHQEGGQISDYPQSNLDGDQVQQSEPGSWAASLLPSSWRRHPSSGPVGRSPQFPSITTETPSGTIALAGGIAQDYDYEEQALSATRNRVPSAAPPPYSRGDYDDIDESAQNDSDASILPSDRTEGTQTSVLSSVQDSLNPFSWFRMIGGSSSSPPEPVVPPVDESEEIGDGEADRLFGWDVVPPEAASPPSRLQRSRSGHGSPFRQPSPHGSPRQRLPAEESNYDMLPPRRRAAYTPSVMTLERLMPSRGNPDIRVAIGLCTRPYPHFYLPGRYVHSVAYVTDHDGAWVTICTTNGASDAKAVKVYELGNDPTVMARQGDTVGIGYNQELGAVFFTVNGVRLEFSKEQKPVVDIPEKDITSSDEGARKRVKDKGKSKIKQDVEVASAHDGNESRTVLSGKVSWWTYLTQIIWRKPRNRADLERGGLSPEAIDDGDSDLDVDGDESQQGDTESAPLLRETERELESGVGTDIPAGEDQPANPPHPKEPEPDFWAHPEDPDDKFWAVRDAHFNFHACVGATGPCQVLVNFGQTPFIWEGIDDGNSTGESWMGDVRESILVDDFGEFQSAVSDVQVYRERNQEQVSPEAVFSTPSLTIEAQDTGEGSSRGPQVGPDPALKPNNLQPSLQGHPSFTGSLDMSLAASSLAASSTGRPSRSKSPFRGGRKRGHGNMSPVLPSDPIDAALAGAPLISEEARLVLAGIPLGPPGDGSEITNSRGPGGSSLGIQMPSRFDRQSNRPPYTAFPESYTLPPSYDTAINTRQLLTITPPTPLRTPETFQIRDALEEEEPHSHGSRRSWDIASVFNRGSPSTSGPPLSRRLTPDLLHLPPSLDRPSSPASSIGGTPRLGHRRGGSFGDLIGSLRRQSQSEPDVELN